MIDRKSDKLLSGDKITIRYISHSHLYPVTLHIVIKTNIFTFQAGWELYSGCYLCYIVACAQLSTVISPVFFSSISLFKKTLCNLLRLFLEIYLWLHCTDSQSLTQIFSFRLFFIKEEAFTFLSVQMRGAWSLYHLAAQFVFIVCCTKQWPSQAIDFTKFCWVQ